MTPANQIELAKLVTKILQFVYVEKTRAVFEAEAESRGISLEQLAAAAIVQGAFEINTRQ